MKNPILQTIRMLHEELGKRVTGEKGFVSLTKHKRYGPVAGIQISYRDGNPITMRGKLRGPEMHRDPVLHRIDIVDLHVLGPTGRDVTYKDLLWEAKKHKIADRGDKMIILMPHDTPIGDRFINMPGIDLQKTRAALERAGYSLKQIGRDTYEGKPVQRTTHLLSFRGTNIGFIQTKNERTTEGETPEKIWSIKIKAEHAPRIVTKLRLQ